MMNQDEKHTIGALLVRAERAERTLERLAAISRNYVVEAERREAKWGKTTSSNEARLETYRRVLEIIEQEGGPIPEDPRAKAIKEVFDHSVKELGEATHEAAYARGHSSDAVYFEGKAFAYSEIVGFIKELTEMEEQ